jgi:NAD(P)-dependent dehydrogenase (short-subunit alcohol dehydrogenase family)
MGERVAGKVAIITGGGTGIGQGIALMLAAEGAQVVVGGRRRDPLEQTVALIREMGGQASDLQMDVKREADCHAFVVYAVDTYGGLDVLVSNAGIYPRRELPDLTQEIWDETVDVNLRGHFFCAKHAIPAMIARGGGSIIFIGSVHGSIGGSDVLAYAAAKGGLWTMTRNLARTYAKEHIRVNYINPGWVASEGEVRHRRELGYPDEWLEQQGRDLVPSGRLQTPEDSAHVAVLLASDESTQITATRFNVDGGLSLIM